MSYIIPQTASFEPTKQTGRKRKLIWLTLDLLYTERAFLEVKRKNPRNFRYDVSVRQNADRKGAAGGERESGVSSSGRVVCYSVAPWLRKFGFIHSRNVGIKLQSWTKSVKNFALSYSQETYSANLATWWPLPGQCCLVGSKNIPTTL